jgi:cell division protein FtsX
LGPGLQVVHWRVGHSSLAAVKNKTTAFIASVKKLENPLPAAMVVPPAKTLATRQVDNKIAHKIDFIFFI